MTDSKFEPISMIVNIVYKGEVIAAKCKLSSDELFGLREGVYNMEEQLKGIANLAVKQAFGSEQAKETVNARENA